VADTLRVHFADGTFEDFDAVGLTVCNDGSLVLQREGQEFVCWLRADQVRRVDRVTAPGGVRVVDDPFTVGLIPGERVRSQHRG
jgi:hypothetical protein